MAKKIITISRQFGSGGRTIGKKLAEELGIPCYDKELIEELAEKTGLAKEYVEKNGEDAKFSYWLSGALSGRDVNGYTMQEYLWLIQRDIIRDIAKKGPCVFVGRCADYILREEPDVLNVFIHSDMESRIKRIVEQYGENDLKPEKRLKNSDKRRSGYYQVYTDRKWGDARNYDITLNSGYIGINKCVEIIKGLL